ncbi:MAG: TolC family protein [bacterium]|nr:TolC family protein [bacterium]
MNKKLLWVLLIFLAWNTVVFAGENTNKDSLIYLWSQAEENSPGILARIKQARALQQKIESLPEFYIPNTSIDLGYSFGSNGNTTEHGPLARLSAAWTLWDGGRSSYSKRVYLHEAESAGWRQKVQVMELKAVIAHYYYRIAFLKERQKNNLELAGQLKRLAALLRPRLKIGKVGPSDLEEVSIRLSMLREKKDSTDELIALHKRQLELLVGTKVDSVVDPVSRMASLEPRQDTKSIVLQSLPEYRSGQSMMKSLKAQLELEKKNLYWPFFGLEIYGGYGPHRDAISPLDPEVGASVRVTMPLVSNRSRSSQLEAKRLELQAREQLIAQKLARAEMDFTRMETSLRIVERRLKKIKKIIIRANRNLARAYREFARGLKSPADMLASIRNLYNIKCDYCSLKTERLNLKAKYFLISEYIK